MGQNLQRTTEYETAPIPDEETRETKTIDDLKRELDEWCESHSLRILPVAVGRITNVACPLDDFLGSSFQTHAIGWTLQKVEQ